MQVPAKQKAPIAGPLQSPLTDSNRRPPPYHGTSHATSGSRWQRISLVFAVSRGDRFASNCRRLQPRGSTKAPSSARGHGRERKVASREARAHTRAPVARKGLRPRLSAKRAVDGDLVQSVLEDGELRLVELRHEQLA